MAQSPRLGRRASIALSAVFAYILYAGTAAMVIPGLLPWVAIPAPLTLALHLVFAVSLLAGARVYTFRPGRLASFARFALGLPLLVAAAALYFTASGEYGFYLFFVVYPIFLWIGLVGIPAWLIAVGRSLR